MARFFPATAMGERFYPEGLGDAGPWRSERLVYYSEKVARIIIAPYPRDALVTTPEDLTRLVSASGLPAVRVWIREDLEDAARRLWEEQRLGRKQRLS